MSGFLKLPWKAKPRVPCERAWKTVSEAGVKSDPAFCLGPSIKRTNSVYKFLRAYESYWLNDHLSQLEVFLGSITYLNLLASVCDTVAKRNPSRLMPWEPTKNSMWCWLIFIDDLSIKSEVIFLNPLKGVWHKQKSDDGDRSLNNSKAVDHNPTDNNLSINLLGTSGISSEISMLRSNLDESLMNVSRESHRSTHGGQ